MSDLAKCMDTGVRPTRSVNATRSGWSSRKGCDCRFDRILHCFRVGLTLPAGVGSAIVRDSEAKPWHASAALPAVDVGRYGPDSLAE